MDLVINSPGCSECGRQGRKCNCWNPPGISEMLRNLNQRDPFTDGVDVDAMGKPIANHEANHVANHVANHGAWGNLADVELGDDDDFTPPIVHNEMEGGVEYYGSWGG